MSDTVTITLDRKQAKQWLEHRHSGIEFAINDAVRAALEAPEQSHVSSVQLAGDVEIKVGALLQRAGLESAPERLWAPEKTTEEAAWLKGRDDTCSLIEEEIGGYIRQAFEEAKLAEHPSSGEAGLREWLRSDEAVELVRELAADAEGDLPVTFDRRPPQDQLAAAVTREKKAALGFLDALADKAPSGDQEGGGR